MEKHFPPAFDQYARAIASLPARDTLLKADLLNDEFLISAHDELEIYYAPFDFVNVRAKVVIVGITPGWTQMEIAFRHASAVLKSGGTTATALQSAKQEASFAGAMRKNLVKMLNEIGLAKAMGLKSCDDLFGCSRHLIHTTSAVRHPVFVRGQKNYTGHSPKLLSHTAMARYVEGVLAPELSTLPRALVVPLGRCVDSVLRHLIRVSGLESKRCLLGFPHPSGANGHRQEEFASGRDAFIQVIGDWGKASL
ncbi:MAG TPA: uracil-DNA glycosylase family protein [Candidatus Acidoferrales bacterium]|nr:uracil-DNA glycosylase family protein [Candidatus Acidoferrales bacterium]